MSIFHFAFNVTDLDQTRAFYGGLLGCAEGRSTDTWQWPRQVWLAITRCPCPISVLSCPMPNGARWRTG